MSGNNSAFKHFEFPFIQHQLICLVFLFNLLFYLNKNPFKLTHTKERLFKQRMVVLVTQVKEMVHRKRVKNQKKNRKQLRMALSLILRQRQMKTVEKFHW